MHNNTLHFTPTLLLPSSPLTAPHSLSPPPHGTPFVLMFVAHVFPYISLIFLLLHFASILLIKLFSFLHQRAVSKSSVSESSSFVDSELCIPCNEEKLVSVVAVCESWDLDIGGEALGFLRSECCEKDTIFDDEGRDSKEHVFLEKDDSFVVPDYSQNRLELPVVNVSHNVAFNAITHQNVEENTVDGDVSKDFLTGDEKQLAIEKKSDFDSNDSKVEEEEEEEEVRQEKVTFGGGSLTGESTSNSSNEWRSSTIFRDSETEYPFSSSSRRSSSNWESFTMFKKYEEEMLFFDKITAQKLAETESFRSKNAKTGSLPKRIINKLMAKPKYNSIWDPFQDLESAYVAQVCLAWEVLNWNYNSFRRGNYNKDTNVSSSSFCPSRIAQRFQQFQVLLQRFIENEPYEYGQRPEIFARMRLSSPKLLQVPEYLCDEESQEMESKISSAEFFSILEDAIQTFMNFLKADKKRLKVFIKRKQSVIDLTHLCLLKKINKKKKAKLKEIGRSKYWKKRKMNEEEQMEIFMAMIDLKVVSRVLRVRQITEEQLHWCEDKMSKVRVWEGKMKRDHAPLFFPVHS